MTEGFSCTDVCEQDSDSLLLKGYGFVLAGKDCVRENQAYNFSIHPAP